VQFSGNMQEIGRAAGARRNGWSRRAERLRARCCSARPAAFLVLAERLGTGLTEFTVGHVGLRSHRSGTPRCWGGRWRGRGQGGRHGASRRKVGQTEAPGQQVWTDGWTVGQTFYGAPAIACPIPHGPTGRNVSSKSRYHRTKTPRPCSELCCCPFASTGSPPPPPARGRAPAIQQPVTTGLWKGTYVRPQTPPPPPSPADPGVRLRRSSQRHYNGDAHVSGRHVTVKD